MLDIYKEIFKFEGMENYIITGKKMKLEKGKEFVFNIPVAFKPALAEFIIECKEIYSDTPLLNLKVKATSSSKSPEVLAVTLDRKIIKFKPVINEAGSSANYLLISASANRNVEISFSIVQ